MNLFDASIFERQGKRPPAKDITGSRFGKLSVLRIADKKGGEYRWLCACDCGKTTVSFGSSLRGGQSKSCGCVAANKAKERWRNPTPDMIRAFSEANTKHGMSRHPAFQAWCDMRQRCNRPQHKWYPSYGGRGITICDSWQNSFEAFWSDMGSTWAKGRQLGRIDNDGPYSPDNCRWETPMQQQSNKSNNRFIDTPGGRMTISQAARAFGLSFGLLSHRLNQGYPMERMFQPSQRSKK